MFGYVIPNKSELKFREFDVYRSCYCALCSSLRKTKLFAAMALTYDLTFLSMLLSSLYEPKCQNRCVRCICHPFKKHCETLDEYSSYAAEMTVILSYYKCMDDFHDDRNIAAYFYALYLRRSFKHIAVKYSEKTASIAASLEKISEYEKCGNLDGAAGAFGCILGEVFTPHDDIWRDKLYELGFYLGKFIYIMDAYDDIAEDIKKNRPNPLIPMYSSADFEKNCENLLNMMGAEAAARFEFLPIIKNDEILRNILYGGIWVKYEKTALSRRQKKQRK